MTVLSPVFLRANTDQQLTPASGIICGSPPVVISRQVDIIEKRRSIFIQFSSLSFYIIPTIISLYPRPFVPTSVYINIFPQPLKNDLNLYSI